MNIHVLNVSNTYTVHHTNSKIMSQNNLLFQRIKAGFKSATKMLTYAKVAGESTSPTPSFYTGRLPKDKAGQWPLCSDRRS